MFFKLVPCYARRTITSGFVFHSSRPLTQLKQSVISLVINYHPGIGLESSTCTNLTNTNTIETTQSLF